MKIYDIVKRPIVTEKTSASGLPNRVVFQVAIGSNKHQIRDAIEKLFSVEVRTVNTAIVKGKPKRFGGRAGVRSNWKKAVVTLAEGQTINFYPTEAEEVSE
jgi:large subunit ribosomal protein L23